MGHGKTLALVALVVLAAGQVERTARAGVVNLDNGVVGPNHLDVNVDDYGAYGFHLGAPEDDKYFPTGFTQKEVTYLAGVYLFIKAGTDPQGTAVLLSDQRKWIDVVENGGDGIAGDRAATMTRTVGAANVKLGAGDTQSAFTVQEATTNPVKLSFALRQIVTVLPTGGTRLEQRYTITNAGIDAALVFHAQWDPDLFYTTTNSFDDDVVGAGPGLCFVTQHDPATATGAVALMDGGSTVPRTYYNGAKNGITPTSGPPAYGPPDTDVSVWTGHGLPASWQNDIATIGKNIAADSAAGLDAAISIEYRFALAAGASATIRVYRIYGTNAITCGACGNGTLDAGEDCDTGTDSPTCNAMTCGTSSCGDAYPNAAAGEQCDSAGVDTMMCDGATCTTPTCGDGHTNAAAGEECDTSGSDSDTCNGATCLTSTCGDGYVNTVAGEDCEPTGADAALCDTTCKYTFKLGGGCTGCGTSGPDGVALVLVVAVALRRRRR